MRAAKLERAKGAFLRSLEDIQTGNQDGWAYLPQIAYGAAKYDPRYGILRKMAQDFGANISDEATPNFYLAIGRHTVIGKLEDEGLVESRYVESDANPHNGEGNPPLQYRLTSVEVPVQAFPETVPKHSVTGNSAEDPAFALSEVAAKRIVDRNVAILFVSK